MFIQKGRAGCAQHTDSAGLSPQLYAHPKTRMSTYSQTTTVQEAAPKHSFTPLVQNVDPQHKFIKDPKEMPDVHSSLHDLIVVYTQLQNTLSHTVLKVIQLSSNLPK